MINKQYLSLTAIVAFSFISLSASADKVPNLAKINPTQALIYYGQRELEAAHRYTIDNPAGYQKAMRNLVHFNIYIDSHPDAFRSAYKHYETIPSADSTPYTYWNDFLNCAIPALIKATSEMLKIPEEKILNEKGALAAAAQGLSPSQNFLKILCIVRTIQRDSRQHIDIPEVIRAQKAAGELLISAVDSKQSSLHLVEKNDELELIWKNFKMPSNQNLQAVLNKKLEEARSSSCLIL